jgi:hypothetical protein
MKRFLKLYKEVNGEMRLVDYGVASQIETYHKQGYHMVWSRHMTPVYKVLKREFDELWYAMPTSEQVRLHDIAIDPEMSMEERLMLLKSEIVRYKKQVWVEEPVRVKAHHGRAVVKSVVNKLRSWVSNMIPEPQLAFGHF